MSHIQTSSDSDDLKRPRITFMQNTHYVSPPHNFRIDCLFPESHPPSKRNRISLSRPAEINYVGPLMKPHVNNSSRLRYRAKKKKKKFVLCPSQSACNRLCANARLLSSAGVLLRYRSFSQQVR